ncbi:MAG: D-cysteine desulfhydrase [Desulfovibrio sp.]|jgi:D-cysteine desulfhydrase|nr:D-cysteine desulfhydrase [Desulfovibrio sp.]
MNLAKLPRRGYVQTPTPIEFLPNFSKALGDKVRIFVKRDDLLPGCGGGNKTRKLDFCLADAMLQGADSVITCGAVQSNHCRLTLAWSVKEGLDCHLVLEERVKGSYRPDALGNNFLYRLLGATGITVVPGGSDMSAEMEKVADALRKKGKNPYIIPGGASSALGAQGYVACAQELLEQLFRMGLDVHTVVLPSGSAGTHAGFLAGLVGCNAGIPVLGIDVSRPRAVQEALVHSLANEAAKLAGMNGTVPRDAVKCDDAYVGEGYSLPTASMTEAVKLLARTEAILLDPVYTGKAMAGLIDLVRKGAFPEQANLLFLHTGGSPALYAYPDTFLKDGA